MPFDLEKTLANLEKMSSLHLEKISMKSFVFQDPTLRKTQPALGISLNLLKFLKLLKVLSRGCSMSREARLIKHFKCFRGFFV